jgi:cell division protein FtsQ
MQDNKPVTNKHALQTAQQQSTSGADKAPLAVGLPVFVSVLLLIIYAGYWANQWLQDEQRLPVQEIVFSGQLNMLNEQNLADIIQKNLTASFFALDVNEVHALMEAQPWVYSASIRKRWPSKLYIYIVEQTAVAIWNSDLLLNQYGDTFEGGFTLQSTSEPTLQANAPKGVGVINQLPELFGPGGSEKTVLKGYNEMQGLLDASNLRIEQLVLSERFAWQAELSNVVVLKLGRKKYVDRLQRYIDVYPLLKQSKQGVEYVDLRYDTGLAVGWIDDKVTQSSNNNNS